MRISENENGLTSYNNMKKKKALPVNVPEKKVPPNATYRFVRGFRKRYGPMRDWDFKLWCEK